MKRECETGWRWKTNDIKNNSCAEALYTFDYYNATTELMWYSAYTMLVMFYRQATWKIACGYATMTSKSFFSHFPLTLHVFFTRHLRNFPLDSKVCQKARDNILLKFQVGNHHSLPLENMQWLWMEFCQHFTMGCLTHEIHWIKFYGQWSVKVYRKLLKKLMNILIFYFNYVYYSLPFVWYPTCDEVSKTCFRYWEVRRPHMLWIIFGNLVNRLHTWIQK